MKKFFLPFVAFVFAGTFDDIAGAAEAHSDGSAESFRLSEQHKTLTFTDADGNSQTLTTGDAIVPVANADGTCKGYAAATAATVAAWLTEVPAASPAPAPAEGSDATNTAT